MPLQPVSKGQNNIAFTCFLQLGDTASCISILDKTNRAPEAALFARTYAPSAVPAAIKTWKTSLETAGKGKLAESLADPETDAERFEEGWEAALQAEQSGGVKAAPANGNENGVADGHAEQEAAPETAPADAEPASGESKSIVGELVEKVEELVVGNGGEADEGEPKRCASGPELRV